VCTNTHPRSGNELWGRSDELDRASGAVHPVDGCAQFPAEQAAPGDREFDRQLQQIGIEQQFMIIDPLAGVAVEATALCPGIN
jgi:hypothetical protein